MNENEFVDIISEDRKRTTWVSKDISDEITEKKLEYKPYGECPRCSEWKLAAYTHEEKEKRSKGFLKGSETVWKVTDRWWKCRNCEAKYDVSIETDDDSPDRHEVIAKGMIPRAVNKELKKEGVTGEVSEDGSIYVGRGYRVRLPDDVELAPGTEVELEKDGGDVYCIEKSTPE